MNATRMASQVTTPLERQLGQMAHLAQMSSRSTPSLSTIELGFDDSDVESDLRAVATAIEAARDTVPTTARSSSYYKVQPTIARYILVDHDASEFNGLVDVYTSKLSSIAGVAHVAVCGLRPRQTIVRVDPSRLAAAGRDPREVISAILFEQRHAPGSPDDLGDRVIGDDSKDRLVQIRDVAELTREVATPDCQAFDNGHDVIAFDVTGEDSARPAVTAVMDTLARELPAREKLLPVSPELHRIEIAMADDHQLAKVISTTIADHIFAERDPRDGTMKLYVDGEVDVARSRLAAIPGVVANDADATLVISSADPRRARTFADGLAPTLVHPVPGDGVEQWRTDIAVDFDRAGKLGVAMFDADSALELIAGYLVGDVTVQFANAPSLDGISVRTADRNALVPLASLATSSRLRERTVVHVGQSPAATFRVRASEVPELPAVPADLHLEIVRD